MILTPKILARLVAVVVLGVILQLSFFSQVAVFHVSPDLLPALVVSLGLLGGTMTGAVSGFSVGFLLDCLLVAPLGGGSLVLLATGYLAGLFRERFEIRSPLVPPLLCMVLTFFAELGFGAVRADARRRRRRQPAGRRATCWCRAPSPSSSAGRSTSACGACCARPWSRSQVLRRPPRPTVLGA